jgi:glycerol-1-phosphate dehydrogenase [NAD(P)+]
MNGYGSANVAATIDGLKVLFHATAPRAVVARPGIILEAPFELSAAGLGDVLAKPVSSADWKLNQFLFQDYYCQFSVDLLKDLEPVYLNNPDKIGARDEASFQALFTALFYSSVAMTVTGTSAPASGGEHLVSHTLDILAGRDGQAHDLHGRQVGVSSILMAALYERVMAIEKPDFHQYPERIDKQFWGSLSPVVEQEYRNKLPRMARAADLLSQPGKWAELQSLIKPHLIGPQRLKQCLERAGAAHTYSGIRMDHAPLEKDLFVSVVNHASQMRDRFTILDLAALLGILPGATGELVDTWVTR